MKLAILHHSDCHISTFHYKITKNGSIKTLVDNSDKKKQVKRADILMEGNYEYEMPPQIQLDSLRQLLLSLAQLHPKILIGGHKNIRGENTKCPGTSFPTNKVRRWANDEMISERDARLNKLIEEQYRPFK